MTDSQVSYPGVYIEEVRTSVKLIPGIGNRTGVAATTKPSGLLAAGYKIIQTQIEPGGLAILFGRGNEHVLVRMSDYREGNSTEGQMLVTFAAKLP